MNQPAKKERSRAYPYLHLEAAVEAARMLVTGLGHGPYSRQHVSEALGHMRLTGSSLRKIGALSHFGLIENRKGGTCELTDLGKRVVHPRDENEFRDALRQAALKPTILCDFVQRYDGHAVPTLLPNILVRDFGIVKDKAEAVASVVRETLQHAGLLNNGIISSAAPTKDYLPCEKNLSDLQMPSTSQMSPGLRDSDVALQSKSEDSSKGERKTLQLELPEDRLAFLDLPKPVRGEDLMRLRKWLDFYEELWDLNKPEASGN